MLQTTAPCRKSASWPQNISEGNVSSSAVATRDASLQIPSFLQLPRHPHVFAHFWQGAESIAPAMQNHILTSKSGLRQSIFNTFDFEMCCAPRGVHFFDISSSLKMIRTCGALQFWRGNVLCATTACTFSIVELPKPLRHWGVLSTFISKTSQVQKVFQQEVLWPLFSFEMCFAPRLHALSWPCNCQKCSENEVFFWILIACNLSYLRSQDGFAPAALASLLFDPPEPQNIGKTQCFALRLFNLSAHLDVLSSDYFSSLIFFVLSFLFSASSHLRCFISPYCREFDFLRSYFWCWRLNDYYTWVSRSIYI